MTDKQIIINNCKLYKDGLCISPLGNEVKCEDISVDKCYFKQKIFAEQELACKTQECETLASQLDFEVQKKECLEQEYERLKKKLMQKSEVDIFFNTPIEGWSSDPCGICKFKNCLTEIKEIAEYHNANAYCNSKVDMRKILQKISECEKGKNK